MKFIYLCGPTVYDKVHLGNMRPIVTTDLFIRAMKHLQENVILIHNITDIDDKIIAKAQELKISEQEVSQRYFEFYRQMLFEFNIKTIVEMPNVVDNINLIITAIQKLIDHKNAYVSNSVYFDTTSIDNYGSLSNQKINESPNQESSNSEKKNPADFVLWKVKSNGKTWDSPWGKGRPGWHTECFSFVEIFGQSSLDIHLGGIDLKFPHHENENAQFLALHNEPITKKWLHIGIMNLNGQKMSKSEKNILYTDDYLSKNSSKNNADIFRLLLLTSNYKNTIEFNDQLYFDIERKLLSIIKIFNIITIEENYIFSKIDDIQVILQDISNLDFSKAMKEINYKIKLFNETKTLKIGNEIISIFKILGFKFTENCFSEEDKTIYRLWKKASQEKNWEYSDELRKKIMHILLG